MASAHKHLLCDVKGLNIWVIMTVGASFLSNKSLERMEGASGFSVVHCNIIFSDQNVTVTPGPSAEERIKKTRHCAHIQCHSAFGRGQIQHLLQSGRSFRTLCYVKYATHKEQLWMCDSHSASCQTHQDRMEVSRAPGRGKRGVLNGRWAPLWDDREVLEMDHGESCESPWI